MLLLRYNLMSSALWRETQDRPRDPLGDRILAAASRILSETGAAGLNVRSIAKQAGTSTMGVYSRFGGKLGLVEALYREGFERLRGKTEPLVSAGEPLEALEALCVAYRDTALANATHYEIMFGRAVAGFEPGPQARAEAFGSFDRVVVRAIRRAVDAGLLRGDPLELGLRLWALAHGMVSLELNRVLPPSPTAASERRYRRAIRAHLQGLQPQNPRPRPDDA